MFEIRFDDEAISFLEKLPRPIRQRLYAKIISTKENPFHYFERLSGRADYRLRVGDYRVIADIRSQVIEVTRIGHRKNIYKKNL
ncbi:type II toxin-antitoxin system RelE/ParE family toxin [Thermoproteota archaeon]